MFKPFKFNHIAVFASIAILVASCSKMDSDYQDLPDAAAVGVVHASAGSQAFEIKFDQNPLKLWTFNFTDRVDYVPAYTGKRSFKVYNADATSDDPIFTKELTFEAGKYYTVFITDTASKIDAVSLRDSTRAAGTDSVRLRFANMSPDAPGLDLYVQGNEVPVATNITYKTASNFFSHLSEANVVFEIRRTGQSALLATLLPMNLYRGNIYTIWCGGYINGNEAAGTRIRLEAFAH